MNSSSSPRPYWRQAGFTLMEALIALGIMAFGMLAIAGFQASLSRNSDVAKQRNEAVRLAQQKIDYLRSFTTLTSDGVGGSIDYVSDLQGSSTLGVETIAGGSTYNSATYSSNTTFIRTWTVTKDGTTAIATDGTDPQKWVKVTVSWNDRAGTGTCTSGDQSGCNQNVTLVSVISRADPTNIKFLETNSGSTTSRTPKNRNIDIPYPATDFGNGTSGFMPGGASGVYFIFDNTSGNVTYRCTGASVVQYSSNTSGCTATSGYLLSGYIFWHQGNPSASDFTITLTNKNNNLQDPPPLNYTDVNSVGATGAVSVQFTSPTTSATKECFVQEQMATSSTHNIDTYVSSTGHDYAFTTYLCVITPVIVTSISTTTARWYGQLTVVLDSTHSLGTGSSNWKLCRFTGDYDSDGVVSNAEHPLYYRGVTGTLDNQNYAVIPGNRSCPTDSEAAPLSGIYTNNNTETHQTQAVSSGTQPYGGSRSTSSQFETTTESSDTTVELPML